MLWTQTLTVLRDILANYYYTTDRARSIANAAGVPMGRVSLTGAPTDDWHNILREAGFHNKVGALAGVASKEYSENVVLQKIARGEEITQVEGPDFREDLAWNGPSDTSVLEKIIGKQSTFLDISFLEIGIERAKTVARIVLADGSTGSGFLIDDNLLITNHHVLPTPESAKTARAQFNYQRTPTGLNAQSEQFMLLPDDTFETSPQSENDWTIVRVDGNPNAKYGKLALERVSPQVGDRVLIVQHPGGDLKQIALYHNTIAFVNATRVQYLTDTLPGSSGSPGFDNKWRVIALHHSGGWLEEPGTKSTYYRNEGIHINAVIDALEAKGILSAH